MKKISLLLPLSSIFIAATAHSASTENSELAPVVVTGNRIAQPDMLATYAAEIHHADDITRSGAIDLYDYLNRYSSVTVLPSYGNPFAQLLDMRGYGVGSGHQNIVVTVNGRRLNNVDTVPQLLSSVPLLSIERIEIIKGSGSVAQGDGAMAGIINIVTKDQTGGALNIAAGSHGYSSTSVSAGITEEQFTLQLLAENGRSDGFRDQDINGEKDDSDSNNVAADLKLFPMSGVEIRAGKERSWLDTTYGDTLTLPQFNNNPEQNAGKTYTGQTFTVDVSRVGTSLQINDNLRLNADYFIEKKDSEYSGGWLSEYDYRSGDYSIAWQQNNLQVLTGVQLFDGERSSATDTTTKENSAAYIQAEYRLQDTRISAGWRREKADYQYRSGVTLLQDNHYLTAWDLGINQKISAQLTVFANLNQGFQAPDIDRFFTQLYDSSWNFIGTGFNGFIKPAESRTVNLGLNHLHSRNKLKAVIFYTDLTDEIYYNPQTFSNTNIDESHKYGAELQNQYQASEQLAVRLNYSWTRAIIDREDSGTGAFNGKDLPGVSEHSATLGVNYQASERGSFSINQIWRSKALAAEDFANNFKQKQKAFNSTDISYQHQFGKLSAYVQVQNLFDQSNGLWIRDDAIYPVNFTRTWYAGIRAEF